MKINQVILQEASYTNMGSDLPPPIKREFDKGMKLAKQLLKKDNIIVWWLRLYKLSVVAEFQGRDDVPQSEEILEKLIKNYNKKAGQFKLTRNDLWSLKNQQPDFDTRYLKRFLTSLEHFLSLNISEINNYRFEYQPPSRIRRELTAIETEWKTMFKDYMPHDPDLKVMIDMGEFVWFDLEAPSCSKEGQAMGHCGNSPASRDPNQTILSLRKKKMQKGKLWWRPVATFILHKKEGALGEMKGRNNKKPKDDYHPYIIKLIEHKRIKEIVGGGYLPESNFSLSDLKDADYKRLVAKKPKLETLLERIKRYGLDDSVKKDLITNWKKQDRINKDGDLIYESNISLEDLDDHIDIHDSIKYAITTMEEGHVDMWDINVDENNIENALTRKLEEEFKSLLRSYTHNGLDEETVSWYDALASSFDDIHDDLNNAYRNATESGTYDEMYKDLVSLMRSNPEVHDHFEIYIKDQSDGKENIQDTKFEIVFPIENLYTEIERAIRDGDYESTEEINDAEMLIENMLGWESLNLSDDIQPNYGWEGFDEEHFNWIVDDEIIPNLKEDIKKQAGVSVS